MPNTDSELLRAFAERNDEAGFAELVRRRIDFVYAAALRQVAGDTHRAEDIAQEVFVKLARHAGKLTRHPALLGWLCLTTRSTAVDMIRSEQRRKLREHEALAMQENETDGELDWRRVQPVLDEALADLNESDREAVLARYFDRQPFAQIAAELGVSKNAAQRRVERALDRLHGALTRRRITSTSAALGAALATHAGMAAPAGLAAAVTKTVLAGSIGAAASAGAGLFAFMSSAKTTLAFASVLGAVGLGTAYLQTTAAREAQIALNLSIQREPALASRVRDMEARVRASDQRLKMAEEQNGKLLAAAATPKQDPVASEPITSGIVNQRFRLAQELAVAGDPVAALRELLWCYDVGMPKVANMGSMRIAAIVTLAKLGERHPPALAALRERREQARPVMMSDEQSSDAVTEFAAINHALKNDAENVALMDQLRADDPRRKKLATASYDYLVENRRYTDALAGRSYALISSLFEMAIKERALPAGTPNLEEFRQQARAATVAHTVKNIEMLAGAGELAHARTMAERLLAYDRSDATKALLQKHAERAGHPKLLEMPASGTR